MICGCKGSRVILITCPRILLGMAVKQTETARAGDVCGAPGKQRDTLLYI